MNYDGGSQAVSKRFGITPPPLLLKSLQVSSLYWDGDERGVRQVRGVGFSREDLQFDGVP